MTVDRFICEAVPRRQFDPKLVAQPAPELAAGGHGISRCWTSKPELEMPGPKSLGRTSGCSRQRGIIARQFNDHGRHIGTYSRCELSEGAYAAVHLSEMPTFRQCGSSAAGDERIVDFA